MVSAPLGTGCITKIVFFDEELFPGAYVELFDATGNSVGTGYTDAVGEIRFCNLEYGTYYLNVDWDNDGVWDTTNEEVTLSDAGETIVNKYYPPTNGGENHTDNNMY